MPDRKCSSDCVRLSRYLSALLALAFMPFSSVAANRTADVSANADAYYAQEAADIRSSNASLCKGCFFLYALDTIVPVPTRFVVPAVISPATGCIIILAKGAYSELAVHMIESRPSQEVERETTGSIEYCPAAPVLRELESAGKPVSVRQIGTLELRRYADRKLATGTTMTISALLSQSHCMLIIDRNPNLAEAMAEVGEYYRESIKPGAAKERRDSLLRR